MADQAADEADVVIVSDDDPTNQPSTSNAAGAQALTSLLGFQRLIIEQVLEQDGLCVMAPGLGLHQILAALLRLQDTRMRQPDQKGTAIIIGSTPWQRQALRKELSRIDASIRARVASTGREIPAEVTADIALSERLDLYRNQSCVFVTTRILVVDLLSGRLSGNDISGIYVLNAHRVSENSGEVFAVRLFKEISPSGFVRGFSDVPNSFSGEFSKAEKIMKALYVRRIYIWPRFQAQVQEDLERTPPQLVELSQPLTPGSALAYEAISDLMDACVKELRRCEKLDTTDLAASSGLFKSFDDAIKRQLASVWNTVSPKTKQIVADLRTLRVLALHLLRFDAVTFLSYLETLRVTEGTKCTWIFHSAAHTLFEAAKSRVYTMKKQSSAVSGGGAQKRTRTELETSKASSVPSSSSSNAAIEPVLDEAPKWHLLREVIAEVEEERKALSTAADQDEAAGNSAAASLKRAAATAPMLIFCQDAFTSTQLKSVVSEKEGGSALLRNLYREYLQSKVESGSLKSRQAQQQQQQQQQATGNGPPASNNNNKNNKYIKGPPSSRMMGGFRPGEQAALTKEAKKVTGLSSSTATASKGAKSRSTAAAAQQKGIAKKGGKKKGAALSSDTSHKLSEKDSEQQPSLSEAIETSHPLIHFVALDAHDVFALWQYKPSFVVVFDPDVTLTRTLELYKAQHQGHPLRVYLLRYEDSPEMDRYQAAVVRERSAFEGLIKAKEIMVLPNASTAPPAGGRRLSLTSSRAPVLALESGERAALGAAANALTRAAGGRIDTRPQRVRVIVDVREFMSSLPAVLHSQGMELVPLTLEVGDYVLSPEIVIERKTIPDLRGSLTSGRLYQQAESMIKYYKTAILLIEFDGDAAFALQASSDITDEIQVYSLTSRLVLLCLHFPRLRLIWSRSLHATANSFKALKLNQDEPDPVNAATVGVPLEATTASEGGNAAMANNAGSLINQSAVEVLRRLPGITEGNYRAVMREAGSLAGLADVPLERLAEIMGGQQNAQRLKDFLQQECKAMFKAM